MTAVGDSGRPLAAKLGLGPERRVLLVAAPAGFDLAVGLVDGKVAAVDAAWSGLRFVRRLRDR